MSSRSARQSWFPTGTSFLTLITAIVMGTVVIFGQTPRTSAETYRFTVDYFNFGPAGKFASKQRVAGDYRKNRDGTAEWTNVTTAEASSLEGDFEAPQRQAYMDGFRYRPNRQLLFTPEFFKDFPATATQAKNLVWDTFMFETFAQQLAKVTGAPYRLPPSDVPLAGTGTFQNANIELTRGGTIQRNGRRLTVLHYDAFFNNLDHDLPGMKLVGRSDYWGDIWVLPTTSAVERATLFEEVIGELRFASQPNPQAINVVRRGSFERVNQ